MKDSHYRKVTRSEVWAGIEATLRATSKPSYIARGTVRDLGSKGMFLLTKDPVHLDSIGDITIDFDPQSDSPKYKITALCKTIHRTEEGVGIKFTSINLSKLQECIVSKINENKEKYTIGG